MDHRPAAFKIEQQLQSDARVVRQIASALKDVTEYPPAVRYATPILVPRDDGMLGVHFRRGGRVTAREWPIALPSFESLRDKLRRLQHHDGHIVVGVRDRGGHLRPVIVPLRHMSRWRQTPQRPQTRPAVL